MATPTELGQEVKGLTEAETAQLNSFLDHPVGIVASSTNQDLEDLADDINALSDGDYNTFVAEVETSVSRKGSRRPC